MDNRIYLLRCMSPQGYCRKWNHGAIVDGYSNVNYLASVWCVENFGQLDGNLRWHRDGAAFYFKSINDLIKFKLVWAEHVEATASKGDIA